MDVLAERLRAQLLSGPPASSPAEAVEHLLAVQAQDPVAARLGVRARSTGLTAADVDLALEGRELVVSWLNRGTLHLVRAEDFWWLHALTTPQLATSNRTRLRQEGVDEAQADRGVEVVRAMLAQGPRTRTALRDALAAAGVPVRGQAVVHVLVLATLRGVCVRGPVIGREQAFVLLEDWLPDLRPVERELALHELGRRYLRSHAPATDRDLAKWAGLPLAAARQALRDCPAPTPTRAALPPPRLLGMFDELLMGWASREPVLGEHSELVTSNGMFRAVMLIGGRAAGTWPATTAASGSSHSCRWPTTRSKRSPAKRRTWSASSGLRPRASAGSRSRAGYRESWARAQGVINSTSGSIVHLNVRRRREATAVVAHEADDVHKWWPGQRESGLLEVWLTPDV